MSESANKEWVLPASIPFESLKAKDLEECVYWLLDAMGAKDLEWRKGGEGGGAADGGRDLEAHFFAPTPDGELERQRWWVECKGRKGTVDADEVKSAVNNAAGISELDYLVIITNTQFSNPTRGWITDWQKKHEKPKVKLWDRMQLERFLTRHPDVVLRLFAQALSVDGRFEAMSTRFWNKLEFVPPKSLSELWSAREQLDLTPMGIFAAIGNEFAHGDIGARPWATIFDARALEEILQSALGNLGYLILRANTVGVEQNTLIRAYAYLILAALDKMPPENVTEIITTAIGRGDKEVPENVQEYLLLPLLDQLLSEMQDVCGSDCRRIMPDRKTLLEGKDEVAGYWARLNPKGAGSDATTKRRTLIIERTDAPCVVGFDMKKTDGCPLFAFEPTTKNVFDLMSLIKSVAAFRKRQAGISEKRGSAE